MKNMMQSKQLYLKLFSMFYLILFASLGSGQIQDVELLKEAESIEQRVLDKVNKKLSMFMTAEQYRVFATANLKRERERLVQQGEMESKSSGQEVEKKEEAKLLPGFQYAEQKPSDPKEVDRKEKSNFIFRDKTNLVSVRVQLLIDKNITPETKNLAVKMTEEFVKTSLGNFGEFEATELELKKPEVAAATPWEWIKNYLGARGDKGMDLLYIAMLALGFLSALIAIWAYYRNKKSAKALNQNAPSVKEKDNSAALCNELLDELILNLNQHPLLTRIFLKNLQTSDRQSIFQTVSTPAMKGIFQKILQLDQIDTMAKSSTTEIHPIFSKVMIDLKRFIQVNCELESKPFGYLVQMTGEQIVHYISNDGKKLATLKHLAPYLVQHQLKEVSKVLTVEEKVQFFDYLENMHQLGVKESLSQVVREEREALDAKMRKYFEQLKNESTVDTSSPDSIELSFLENDKDCIAVLKQYAAKRGNVPKAYEKYLVSFDEFLGLELGLTKKVMQRVSNEVLLRAFANRKIDDSTKQIIGDMRSQLIESLMKREQKFTTEEVETARQEILKAYRAYS